MLADLFDTSRRSGQLQRQPAKMPEMPTSTTTLKVRAIASRRSRLQASAARQVRDKRVCFKCYAHP